MKIYLHIGTHKTGTTVIQRFLGESKKLEENGYRYLPSRLFSKIEKSPGKDAFYTALANAVSEVEDDCKLIISYEKLSGAMVAGYSDAENVAAKLSECLSQHAVQIVVYYREQSSFLQSAYTQSVHQGQGHSFDEFYSKIDTRGIDWQAHKSKYEKYFGAGCVTVRPYCKERFYRGDLISDFLHAIEFPEDKIGDLVDGYDSGGRKVNPGYSSSALNLAVSVNPMLEQDERKELRAILQRISSKNKFERYSILSDELNEELYHRYYQSNKNLGLNFEIEENDINEAVDESLLPRLTLSLNQNRRHDLQALEKKVVALERECKKPIKIRDAEIKSLEKKVVSLERECKKSIKIRDAEIKSLERKVAECVKTIDRRSVGGRLLNIVRRIVNRIKRHF
ncbi:hypothetical protein EDC56_2304 [Sinobacterium caligoides]|uniref:Sulfotransferase domain-containing protein n=1 Tax=Sinobacterium caligoides TaxID=933926 RepID=A0A3N2DRC9_9GAMM|nr:hypothetical protein [Sinobacterium caligoides]ROS01855.1 hypothetical protein EDC56_2304 [Sinobacterium caligoides]